LSVDTFALDVEGREDSLSVPLRTRDVGEEIEENSVAAGDWFPQPKKEAKGEAGPVALGDALRGSCGEREVCNCVFDGDPARFPESVRCRLRCKGVGFGANIGGRGLSWCPELVDRASSERSSRMVAGVRSYTETEPASEVESS
jgi:hypothetical protein